MGFKCGIVGLPNVGKSTLFNALTNSSKAQAANFPFCTIDPNIGLVPVPDERLDNLVNISKSKKKIYTTISFVDIAGLVKGASKGEGLGNKFLSHIREVDAIIHMIRCFDSDDIQNVNPDVNPVRDLEIIETEMKLADLESIQKRLDKKNRKNIEFRSNPPLLARSGAPGPGRRGLTKFLCFCSVFQCSLFWSEYLYLMNFWTLCEF